MTIRQTIRSVRLKERFQFSLWMQKLEGYRYPRFSMHKPHSETCRNPRLVRTSSFGFSLPTMRCSPTFNGQGKTATVTPTTAATSAQHWVVKFYVWTIWSTDEGIQDGGFTQFWGLDVAHANSQVRFHKRGGCLTNFSVLQL